MICNKSQIGPRDLSQILAPVPTREQIREYHDGGACEACEGAGRGEARHNRGIRADARGRTQNPPAARGDTAGLVALLQGGAEADAVDPGDGVTTALHVAIMRGNPAAARVLLEHGASPTRADVRGLSPLHLAALTDPNTCSSTWLASGRAP